MNPSLDNMLDLLTQHMWKELGPLDPNWFDTLTAEPHAVNDPDELCANQEGHFKIPFNISATESQLFSTPRGFRHAHLSSVETEEESEIDAEPGKAFWTAKSPDLYEARKRDPVLKHGVNIQLQSQDAFNLLQTPQKLETSYTKAISESLGVNVQADISWSSSFNTPPAVPSTLILSHPEESPRPMSLSDEKGVVIVRKLFPSLSNSSRVGPSSPANAPFERDAEPTRSVEPHNSPDVERDHSYCDSKQKSPAANQDEDFCVSENTLDAFLPNNSSSLIEVKAAKRNKVDMTEVQRCIAPLTELEEPDSVSTKPNKAPDLKSPLKSQDGNTQWSPLSLSGVTLSAGETCHNPTAREGNGSVTAAVKQKPPLSFTHTGSSKKKRTFIYTVKQAAAQAEEKQTPSCRIDSSLGQDVTAIHNPHPTAELECSTVRNAVAERSCEMLPPDSTIGNNLPLSAHVQDFDMSQLNRVFAQDFSQMLSICKPHSAAEGDTQNGFSPSLCLKAIRLAKQKARHSNFDASDAGLTPKSKDHLSCVTHEPSIADSGFQSVAPDVSFASNMLSAGETSQSKTSTMNGEGFLRDPKLTCIGNEGEAYSTSEASMSGFKTASSKGIIISSANVEKAKRLFEEFEGETSQLGAPPMDCISVPKDQRSGEPQMSNRLNQKCQLTPSQKADVTELCSLLEEAESQFEFTQFKAARQPCEDPEAPLDADFLSGIDFDDSFSSEQEKPVIAERSNMAPHLSAFRSEASPLKSGSETNGPLVRASKKCFKEAKALLQTVKEDSHHSLPTRKSDNHVSSGDLLGQKSCATKEKHHSHGSHGFQTASGKGISISAKALEKASAFFKDLDDTVSEEVRKANTCLVNPRPGSSDVKKELELDPSEEAVSHRQESSDGSQNPTLKNFTPCTSVSVGFSTASGKKISVSASAISKAKSLLDEVQMDGNFNEPPRSENRRNGTHASSGFQTSAAEAAADSSLPVDKQKSLLKDFTVIEEEKASTVEASDPTDCSGQLDSWKQVGLSATKKISNDISAGSDTKGSNDTSHIHSNKERFCDSVTAFDKNSVKANDLFKDSNGFPATEMDGIDEFFNDSEGMDVLDCGRNHVEETGPTLADNKDAVSGRLALQSGLLADDTKRDDPSLSCGTEASVSDEVILAAVTLDDANLQFEKTNGQRAKAPQYGGFKSASGKSATVSAAALQKAKSLLNNLEDKLDRGEDRPYKPTVAPVMAPPSMSSIKGGFCTASGKKVTISEDALRKANALFKDIVDEEVCEESKHVEDTLPPQKAGGNVESNRKEITGVIGEELIFKKPLSPPLLGSSTSNIKGGFQTASGKGISISAQALEKASAFFKDVDDTVSEEVRKANTCLLNPQPGSSDVKKELELDPSEEAVSHRQESSDGSQNPTLKNFTPCASVSVGFSTASGKKISVSASAISKAKSLLDEIQMDSNLNEPPRSENRRNGTHASSGFQTSAAEAAADSSLPVDKQKSLLKDFTVIEEEKASTVEASDPTDCSGQLDSWKQVLSDDISADSGTKESHDTSQIHPNKESCRDSAFDKNSVKANDLFKDSNGFPAAEMDGIDEFFNDSEGMDVLDCGRNHVEEAGPTLADNKDAVSGRLALQSGLLDNDTKRDDPSLSCGTEASVSDEVILAAVTLDDANLQFEKTNGQRAKAPQYGGFKSASGKSVTVSAAALQKAKSLLNNLEDKLDRGEDRPYKPTVALVMAPPSMSSIGGFCTASGKKVTISEDALRKANALFKDIVDEEVCEESKHVEDTLPPQKAGGSLESNRKEITGVIGEELIFKKPLSPPLLGSFQTASGKVVSFSSAALRKARSLFSDCDDEDETKSGQMKMDKEKIQDSSLFESPFNHGVSTAAGKKVSVSNEAMEKASRLLNDGQFQDDRLKRDKDLLLQGGFQTASGKGVSFSTAALKKAKSLFSECEGDDASHSADFKQAGFTAASGKPVGFSAQALQKARALFDDICVENMSSVEAVDGKHKSEDVEGVESTNTAVLLTSSVSLTKEDRTASFPGVQSSTKPTSDKSLVVSLNLNGCSETQQEFLAQEALDCTKALLMDESDADLSMTLENMPPQQRKAEQEEGFSKKRFREEQGVTDAHPPLKRRLLEEFDRTVDASRGFDLRPEKHCPTDRRVSQHSGALHPYVSQPDRDGKNYSESNLQSSTAVDVESSVSSFVPPFFKNTKKAVERNCRSTSVPPAFVPPFKKHRPPAQINPSAAEEELCGAAIGVKHFQPPAKKVEMKAASKAGNINNEVAHSVQREPETGPSDVTLESIQLAQSMQEMRIRKKRRQTIRPQPGTLFTTRTSGAPRLTWKTAVGGRAPAKYVAHQLYEYGVAPHVAEVSSESAESFRFSLQHFLKQEAFKDNGGVQIADGGWLVPCRNGTAGKVEFYRALCDTPGVDPKLISQEWVFNHYRWVVWKLASLERSFPQTMCSRCLTPEQVLLQLKYRYDVEVDNSRRPALRRIMEKDDTSAKTLVLCVCGVVSRGHSPAKQRVSEVKAPQDGSRYAVVWLTDGWYSIKAQLDEPLTAMLHKGRLAVGGKLIINGAQMLGSQEACSPLEAPESLMLKISANSVRPARWDTKLGFYKDPRPFTLPLASLFHNGGPVGCVDVVVLRIYPTQWMERTNGGSVVFRCARAEEREARRFSTHKEKAMEVLFAKIQADFENEERANKDSRRRTRPVTRRDLERLQDGEELYETVGDDLEARLSSQQLETLQTYMRSLMERKQAELQDRCRRALEESDKKDGGCPQRDVTPVWRISVADCLNPTGQVFQLSFWRPSSDLQSSLKEGSRYKVLNLMTSEGKKRVDFAPVQLTSTKKTQIQEVQTSERLLSTCFRPRVCVRFSDLQNPEFTSLCGEVDLTGKVVSVVDPQGPSPAFFLADPELNFIKVRCFSSLAECGVAELVKPGVLLALSNLLLRGQSNVPTPVVYSGDLTVFSTNPKEPHLRESIERLQNQIQDDFSLKAEEKLSTLMNGPRSISSPAPPLTASVSHADVKTGMPVRGLGSVTPVSRTPAPATSSEKDPRSLKRRRALDYLSRILSPPPLSHLGSLSSPCVKKTFNPPRRSGTPSTFRPPHSTTHSKPVVAPAEDEWVNDEELAMIDTQALL
ncbi:breast cancer type 2 susceptibility protein [Synchiropus splendidus]|uniref:breast cancer type 2 susceptibility protein n=1 Tax=Synchiropus splendidus TaxID=270530 RepID=UPI00237E7FC0|nr:breast cancer type 2 susceptibility protein [Synchiropus splendidus]XP_053728707.1 breast cancer type 2 susceptibility protein [Synchiropus splendidus]